MVQGVVAELEELIALRRFAHKIKYKPEWRLRSSGNHLSKWRGRGMDFAEVRNYQAGDEIRNMEWRVTARTGRPHVKLYQEERERPVMILADFNPSMYFGTRHAFKSVIAARLSAMIAWTAVKQGDKVGGLLYSADKHHELIPRSRESGVVSLLAALSQYTRDYTPGNSRSRPLGDALLRLRRVTRPGSILVLVSDFYRLDENSEKHLRSLRAHNDLFVYHICDPLELQPPPPALYAITNGHQELLLDTTVGKFGSDYQGWCDERLTAVRSLCKRLQIQYRQVTGATDIPGLVKQSFPGRTGG